MADVSADWTADAGRGVSTTVGYVLNLGVATILVTTLLLSAGSLVEDQRENAARTELRVVSERIVGDLAAADRLARASDDGNVRLTVSVPTRVVGSVYEIRVNESGNERVVLVSENPDIVVSVPFESETHVPPANHSGGDFAFVSEGDGLEVEDA
jgi:hypothetical protein